MRNIWSRLFEGMEVIKEGAVEQSTMKFIQNDRIDPSGGVDRKIQALAQEIDSVISLLERGSRDPNQRTGRPDAMKVARAWNSVLVALKGER